MPHFRICTPSSYLFLPRLSQQYLMRVALPMGPFFKTECEVTTLAYSVHPSVLHDLYAKHAILLLVNCSSAVDELGFEWVLIEKIEGVPLADIWD